MNQVGKSRNWVRLSLAVLIALILATASDAALFGLFGSKKKQAAIPSESLVVFPFDLREVGANVPVEFGEDVASTLRTMLSGNSRFIAFLYSEQLPPIRRAKEDSTLKTGESEPPFVEEPEKYAKLADILAGDYYLVGAVDGCDVDVAKRQAQVTLTAELIKMVGPEKGKLLRTLTVTGTVPESVKASEAEELRAIAAGDAVAKLKEELVKSGEETEEAEEVSPQ